MQLHAMEPQTLSAVGARDTIAAISTAPGVGGIAVIRLSGPEAICIADKLWHGKPLAQASTHTAHLGTVTDTTGAPLDQAIVTVFRAPRSYTGDDVVEIAVHGSTYIQRALLQSLIDSGARLAEPGEYTRRAFANGRLDLAQAESVADLIASRDAAAHKLALSQMRGDFTSTVNHLRDRLLELASLLELELDFSEEDVEFADRSRLSAIARETRDYVSRLVDSFRQGNAIRNGIPVSIIGAPNAGKSTLLNMLVGDERAIVSDIPGTTRDTIEDTVQLGGHTFRFIDTAGLRQSNDTIEAIGISRARATISRATIVIWVIDASAPGDLSAIADTIKGTLAADATLIVLLNKTDLEPHADTLRSAVNTLTSDIVSNQTKVIHLSHSKSQPETLDTLKTRLAEIATTQAADLPDIVVTNIRHHQALSAALDNISRVITGLETNIPTDLVAQDLRDTINALSTITGAITTPTLLNNIFSKFCIGK